MKRVAVFDFDHTLISGDSFWPYLSYVSGKMRTFLALMQALIKLIICRVCRRETGSLRTFVKSSLLRSILLGKTRTGLKHAAIKTRLWQKENALIVQRLRAHAARGDKIVIASGGLDLYLPEALRGIPHDALICTNIGVENGYVTGEMIDGNCVRLKKAERVGQWLLENGPFEESFAYGNYPDDVPMMNLVKHRIIVS